ncbi:divalent-cation tolerance protein CutA [Nocardia tengchongensis]|uniref:divalent-cation tolerance protein CutA n=1 Tax=Nocardia tengchongensis TaxID=2055889 RepID=UPI0036800BA0
MTEEARVWSVTTTTPTETDAQVIARTAVAERLAAGAEVTGPAWSVFWHLDQLGEGPEWRVTLKTSAAVRDKLAARMLELHPWASGPEITATPVEWAIDSYVMWVEKTTTTTE